MARNCTTIELYLLCLSAFCLPIFEAPKNVASITFVFFWFLLSFRKQLWGIRPSYEGLIIGLAAVLLLSSFLSPMSSAQDALRWTLLAVFVTAAARLNYTSGQAFLIASCMFLGHIAAVGESFWIWVGSQNPYPEFRSVGHVNHSVMYSNVVFGLGLAATFARPLLIRYLGLCSVGAAIAYWIFSISVFGAITMVSIGLTVCVMWAFYKSSVKVAIFSLSIVLTLISGISFSPFGDAVILEVSTRFEAGEFFAGRDKIMNSALAVWKLHPILGTGWFSFGDATSEQAVRASLTMVNIAYDPSKYLHTSHGHNLWVTVLIERGLLGVVLVSALLMLYLTEAVRGIIKTKYELTEYRWYGITILLTTIGFAVGGLGNTTMMNEHGQAGMMVIAIAGSRLRSLNYNTQSNTQTK